MMRSCVLLLVTILVSVSAAADRPDLVGKVYDTDGKPLVGATAYVYTAGVKTGFSPYCPSCYADCGKKSATDASGAFTIASLDPELVFRILVVAEGYKPEFVAKVDPAKGPIEAKLKPVPKALDEAMCLKGRVLGPDGQPVVGATVSPEGCKTVDRGRWWGATDHIDAMSITNSKGEFVLHCEKPTEAIDVQVEARGLATTNFELLAVGKPHELRIGTGATVVGKATIDGKPLANASIGLVQENRRCGVFTGARTIGTNENGEFTFSNVGPKGEYFVYGIMAGLGERGAIPIATIQVSGDGSTSDAGELKVQPAFKLAGRVILSDGKPVPAGTRVLIGRDDAWDTQIVTIDADGRFSAVGVPREQMGVSVRVSGYHLSTQNVSLDTLNLGGLDGLVDRDITDLTILLEPGTAKRPEKPEEWKRASESARANTGRRIQGVPSPVSANTP